MYKNIKIILCFCMLFIAAGTASAKDPITKWIDPHDSLLFDGTNPSAFETSSPFADNNCLVKVGGMNGIVIGKVIKRKIVTTPCGTYINRVEVDKKLEIGDTLVEGSDIITSKNSFVGLKIFLSTDDIATFSSLRVIVGESSEIKVPNIQYLCERLEEHPPEEEIRIIKGIVTYDPKEVKGAPKFTTKGKNTSAKHKQTRYSHEVKIDGSDTIDVIRVYIGSVEVTRLKTDYTDEENQAKEMEKLSQDMQDGKITMEEFSAKMNEIAVNSQNSYDLMKPVIVDEGSKCTVTKKSMNVEPLSAGDEDQKWEE